MSNIKIYGRLENATVDNLLAGTSLLFDDELNKFQSLINKEVVFKTEKGVANGVATLNSSRKIPSEQLPSYVDDVLEYELKSDFPVPGEEGKIYVAKDNNNSYRWSGSLYILIGTPLELGETSTTAYSGDKGKATTDRLDTHINNTDNPHNVTKAQVGLGSVDNTSDVNKPISTALSQALDKKVDKVANKSLVSDSEITKLSGLKSLTELNTSIADAKKAGTDALTNLSTHINDKANPHNVTKALVGLSNVDNTSDINKPISTAVLNALNNKADISELNNKITSNIVSSVITLTKTEYQNLEVKDNRTIYLIVDSVLTLENGALILVE